MQLVDAPVGVHSAWPLRDPAAWSGVIAPMVRAIESVCEPELLEVPPVGDALVDRARARLSPRTVLPSHSRATAQRRSAALGRVLAASPTRALVSLASSTDLVLDPGRPTVQVTDATFDAVSALYPLYADLSASSRRQGRWVERRAALHTHHYLVASVWARDSLVGDIGVPPFRVTVAPFGPAITPEGPRPPRAPGDVLRLLLVARDWERKNGAAALRVLSLLRHLRPVELTIVGDAPAELPPGARAVGRLDAAQLSRLYAHSDLLLEPSRANASGVVITDALTHGLPVLAVDAGGVSTLVRHGVGGWLVDPGQVEGQMLARLVRLSPQRLAQVSSSAAEDAARRLSWEAWAQQLAAVTLPAPRSIAAQERGVR